MPDTQQFHPSSCEEFEEIIIECFCREVSPAERAQVAAHVAVCARCRATWESQELLDSSLSARLSPVGLPRGFKERLLERVRVEQGRVTEATVAESAQTQSASRLVERARVHSLLKFFDLAGYASLAVIGMVLAVQVFDATGMDLREASRWIGTVMAAGCVMGGVWRGCGNRIRALLNWG